MEQQQQPRAPRDVKWTSPEILGEMIILAFVLILAIYFLVDMGKLKWPGRYLPLITIGFAAPFWIWRIRSLFLRKKWLESGAIMDLGFRFGDDPAGEKRRAVQFITSLAVLFVGLWLFGFHIFLPLWVMGYLFIFQKKMNIIIILIIGAVFEGYLLGIQDYIIDVLWPEPLFWQWIGVDYLFQDWPISETY